MARIDTIQTNFTGGELSPELALGRPDIQKFSNGVRRALNVSIRVQGGAKRRPGTLFVAAAKFQDRPARLIDFIFNRSQAYVLEMGDSYMRFFRNRAPILASGSPYEIATPYTVGTLRTVNFVQKADTAFFAQETVWPHRLQRFGDASWALAPAPFDPAPVAEQGHYPGTTLTLAANTGSTTATAGGSVFLPSDVGRSIVAGVGLALITGIASATVANVTVQRSFSALSLGSGTWGIDGSPMSAILLATSGAVGDVGAVAHADASFSTAVTISAAAQPVAGYTDVAATAHGFSTNDVVQVQDAKSGSTSISAANGYYVAQVLDANTLRIPYKGQLFDSGTVRKLQATAGAQTFRAEDVGKIVFAGGGALRITEVPNATVALGRVLATVDTAAIIAADAWTLEDAAWNARNGFPRAVTLDRQRLLLAGTPAYPLTIWGSKIAAYLNYTFSTNDDGAFRFELDGPRNSPIRHLAPARKLLVLTDSDEMSLQGGQEKAIGPTNIQKTDESTAGSNYVRPVKVGAELLNVQAAGRIVSGIGYRYEIDGYAAPDRTVFASHITGPGIIDQAFQKDPNKQLMCVRADGLIAACTYDMDQEVSAWARWETSGQFESVASIPTVSGEETWCAVARQIGGTTRRYVEVFDPDVLVDCGIARASVAPGGDTVWTGLGHLEGREVVVYGDGSYQGHYTVVSGQITVARALRYAQIGLPFNVEVEPLEIELATAGGTSMAAPRNVREVQLRVLDTTGAQINGRELEFRRFDTPGNLDSPPPVESGTLRALTLEDSIYTASRLVISQAYPMPFHLLDIIRRVTVNA